MSDKRFVSSSKKNWVEAIAGTFANDPSFETAMRYGREWRDSERVLEPKHRIKIARLRQQYIEILRQIKPLGPFKTLNAAAEYVHREFNRRR